jgi:poly-gamma-glutamate capsule biosynthesis protein CapA/YwtB (metallophosphatase superfamily)
MGTGARRAATLVAAAGLVTACTSGNSRDADPAPAPSSGTTPSAATTEPTSPSPTDTPRTYQQPLVIAVNIHRPVLDLSARQANRLVAGRIATWDALGHDGGALTVAKGRAAVRAVLDDPDVVAVIPATKVRPTVQVARVGGIDPLVSPRSYPLQVGASGPPGRVTTMTVVGDIMLGRGVGATTPAQPGDALQPLSGRLARPDLTVGNLESTLSDDGRPRQVPRDDSFHAVPAVVPALVDAGFDLVSLANNHTGDYGPRAFVQTLSELDGSRLKYVGAGRDAAAAWAPTILKRNGMTFGFLAFNAIGETPRATAHRPGVAEVRMQPRTGPLNESDLNQMTSAIHELSQAVDVVVVLPHWGDQYTHQAVPDQRRVGRALVEAGADLVLGGHPHWVQGVDLVRGGLVVHSLGNFIFDMDFQIPTQEGAMLDLVFWGDTLKSARFVPYVIGPDFAPRIATGPRAHGILDDIWSTSTGPFHR